MPALIVYMEVKAPSNGGNLLRWVKKITHGLTCNLTTPPSWHLMKWTRCNKRNKLWSSMNTLNFEWHFCSCCCRCCLTSHLLTVNMKNCLTPKKSKNVQPCSIINTIESATPSSSTLPLASYKEVPPPLLVNIEECQMMFKHRLPLCHQRHPPEFNCKF